MFLYSTICVVLKSSFNFETFTYNLSFSAECCPRMESLNRWSAEDTSKNPAVRGRERTSRTVRESTTLRWPERYLSYQGHKDKIHGLDVKMTSWNIESWTVIRDAFGQNQLQRWRFRNIQSSFSKYLHICHQNVMFCVSSLPFVHFGSF